MAGIATQCQSMDIQNESASADCYWLNFIQGNNFRAEVHEAFVDYSINMNLLYPIGSNASEALTSESQYEVFCYAEDDWSDQACCVLVGLVEANEGLDPGEAGELRFGEAS